MTEESPDRRDDRRARARILSRAIDDTVDFLNRHSRRSVLSLSVRSGFLVSNCYFLISDAYKKTRGMEDSRTHYYKVAAFTVAAIMAVRPIRVADAQNVVSIQIAFANQQCALRATQALLGLDLEVVDADFMRRLYASVFDTIEMPCLSKYLSDFEQYVPTTDQVSFETIEAAVPFNKHEIETFSKIELATIDNLITQFTTMERAYGHPFLRVLFGWMWTR